MTPQTEEQIKKVIASGTKNFRTLKLPSAVFDGMDLKNADFRSCSLTNASFRNCNLTYVNFEHANLIGSDFTDAVCHRTNFKDANLSYTTMACKDMFGCTFTLECKSFDHMKPSQGWWAGWLMYALLMEPPSKEHRERLITAMGIEYWNTLRTQYASRQW